MASIKDGVVVSLVVILSIQLVLLQMGSAVAAAGVLRQVPAMFVLGDSTLDVGNNNFLTGKDVPRANKPYYGIDYPGPGGPKPTGRFSNGYNVADYIAKNLGFHESPPPYLSMAPSNLSLALKALTTGVSYASGGAGVLDSTNPTTSFPLSTQVRYMEATRAAMMARVGTRAVRALLARSFFLMGVGSNDMFVFVTEQSAKNRSTTQSDVAALYAGLVAGYSAAVTKLYEMGARKFGIINVGLVGCVPLVRVVDAAGACNDDLNQLAAGFDSALESLMASLAGKLPGLAYSLTDSHGLSLSVFADPAASGYTSIDTACCGSGRLGAEADCLPTSTNICGDRDKLVFWDRVHPSQRANFLTARAFYDGPAQFTTPINFKQLARK